MSSIARVAFLERVSGLTLQQLDYWTREGWLKAELRPRRNGARGERFWPEQEVDVARLTLRLATAGWYAEVAASIARGVVEGWIVDPHAIRIGPGLTLNIQAVP